MVAVKLRLRAHHSEFSRKSLERQAYAILERRLAEQDDRTRDRVAAMNPQEKAALATRLAEGEALPVNAARWVKRRWWVWEKETGERAGAEAQ